jgi:hypothetical protein
MIQNDTLKNLKNKFAYVTNETAETSIKNQLYHYTTPHKTITYNTNVVKGDHTSRQ